MQTPSTDTLSVTEDEAVVELTLNRPDSLNAIDVELAEALHGVLSDMSEAPEKALLLTGAGDVLCAGADLDVVTDDEFSSAGTFEETMQEILYFLSSYPRPTVVACKGAAVGVGFVFALDCDIAILGEETTFSYPEVQLGLASNRTPSLISHLAGVQAAKEIALTGEPVDPERAHELGLVFDVVPETDVDGTSRDLARELADHDPDAVAFVKETLDFGFDPAEFRGLDH